MFRNQVYPSPSARNIVFLEDNFKQKPTAIPLELPLIPTTRYVLPPQNNYVPIIAIVSVISFFGLLAFLAYMRKS